MRGDPKAAPSESEPVLSFAHSRAERIYQQGVWHEENGQDDEALPLFERAVAVDPDYAPARVALAYHYRRTDRLAEALDQAWHAVRSESSPTSWYTLGHMLALSQSYPDALEALHHCLSLDPTYDRAYHQIAFVYYLQGEYDIAITEFHRARLHEPDWQTLFFLGECYRLTDRIGDASHVFNKALSHAANWTQVRITRGQLAACTRLSEFPPHHTYSAKDRAYCDSGVVYLGSQQDDGVDVPFYPFYQFDYHDLAVTLHRLVALYGHLGWSWASVAPVDDLSLPLAFALAELLPLDVPERPAREVLYVQAVGYSVEPLQSSGERLPGQSFCLLSCWTEEWLPDIVGLATPLQGSLPWYHVNTIGHLHEMLNDQDEVPPQQHTVWRDQRSPVAIAADIVRAYQQTSPEATLEAQLNYYTVHRLLRWKEQT